MASLERQILSWADRRPYRSVRRQNVEFTRHSEIIKVTRVPPLEHWSLVAGDAFHNLRSSLDHLVYAIGMNEADPANPPDPRKLAFPLTDTPDDFKSKFWRIAMLSPNLQTEIGAFQPYNRPHQQVPSLLGVLRDFDDLDKHRVLQMAMAQVTQATLRSLGYAIKPGEKIEVHTHLEEVVDGTEIVSIIVNRPTPNMHYKFVAELAITLPHAPGPKGNARSPVIPIFNDIAAEVDAAVERVRAAAS
jgi:hypothetical protein